MHRTTLLGVGHRRRKGAEQFIKETFEVGYGARLESFPSNLIALFDSNDEILCAAGLRFVDDGFFSERYLDSPVEEVVSAASSGSVKRSAIFEVTTLASRSPQATAGFIASIGVFGENEGFEWSFFTLTRRLHLMVERLGIALVYLAEADRQRIADAARWGSYYACEPRVFAVASRRLAIDRDATEMERRHAAGV